MKNKILILVTFLIASILANKVQAREANNEFAFKLYKQYDDSKENVFVSPYGVSLAASLVYDGAKDATKKEMQNLFNFEYNKQMFKEDYAEEYNLTISKNYDLFKSSSLWISDNYILLLDYMKDINGFYNSKMEALDFIREPAESKKDVNKWIEKTTNGKFKEIVSNEVNEDTKLILLNAVSLKADWNRGFDKTKTKVEEFFVTEKKKIQVKTMHADANFLYAENDDVKALSIPYKGNELEMLVLLPNKKGLKALDKYLEKKELNKLEMQMEVDKVNVSLPKFNINKKLNLKNVLLSLGLETSFNEKADFSGITGDPEIYIDDIIQKVSFKVDEKGGKDSVILTKDGEIANNPVGLESESRTFKANHPFIFLIKHKYDGTILFMGRMTNPNL